VKHAHWCIYSSIVMVVVLDTVLGTFLFPIGFGFPFSCLYAIHVTSTFHGLLSDIQGQLDVINIFLVR
jgi:hypothetical protein